MTNVHPIPSQFDRAIRGGAKKLTVLSEVMGSHARLKVHQCYTSKENQSLIEEALQEDGKMPEIHPSEVLVKLQLWGFLSEKGALRTFEEGEEGGESWRFESKTMDLERLRSLFSEEDFSSLYSKCHKMVLKYYTLSVEGEMSSNDIFSETKSLQSTLIPFDPFSEEEDPKAPLMEFIPKLRSYEDGEGNIHKSWVMSAPKWKGLALAQEKALVNEFSSDAVAIGLDEEEDEGEDEDSKPEPSEKKSSNKKTKKLSKTKTSVPETAEAEDF